MWSIPLVGAGLGAVGNIVGGIIGNQAQSSAAANQMAFQDRERSTAYQTAVADMEKAGLNPALMYGGGAGAAAAPAGAQPNVGNVVGDSINRSLSSAADVARTQASIDQMRLQNDNLRATNEQIKAGTLNQVTQAGLNQAQTQVARNDADIKASTAKVVAAQAAGADIDKDIQDSSSRGGVMGFLNYFSHVLKNLNPLSATAKSLISTK